MTSNTKPAPNDFLEDEHEALEKSPGIGLEEGEAPPGEPPLITLTPTQALVFAGSGREWCEDLFEMGARRLRTESPVANFWAHFAEAYIQHLSRLPDDVSPLVQEPMPFSELERIASGAPPMPGGEYLSGDALMNIWRYLAIWVARILDGMSLSEFMAEKAPLWRRVGRLTFHLAENKGNPEKPFAFMVTFVPSLTADGRDKHAPLKNAIKFYSQRDKPEFLRLLTHMKAAAEKLPWVKELDERGGLYKPLAWGIDKAYRFLKDIPVLEESGLTVRIPDWWRQKPKVRVKVTVGEDRVPTKGLLSMLDWDVKLAIGDQNLTPEEIGELLNGPYSGDLIYFKGQWLEANRDQLSEALSHWSEALETSRDTGMTFLQAMRLLSGFPSPGSDKDSLALPEPSQWVRAEAGKALKNIFSQLRDPKASLPPEELTATLRPYQKEGLSWLYVLTGLGLGGCLADDMGLGKTIQVLALLLLDKQRLSEKKGPLPSLLVAPASLLANWRAEAERFTPTLKLKIFHPAEASREAMASWESDPSLLAEGADLVVTSYSLLYRRIDFFKKLDFRLAILDEAQAIKNPSTNQSKAVRSIKAQARLILTGTPVENRLLDLWSLFDFINSGLLGGLQRFREITQELEKRKEDQYGPLRRLISPYLLRRLKTDQRVINDLPDKVENDFFCQLTKEQASLYQQLVDSLAEELRTFPAGKDKARKRGIVLQHLTRFKQLINHPAQLLGDGNWDRERSGKFQRLEDLAKALAERQERLLVFTQYKEIIEPISLLLEAAFGGKGLSLHGGTPVKKRQGLVDEFQDPSGPPFFILSLKAGGTGLNLTAAGHVVHFDRWWNPASEDQATDRAYRIGQKKNVQVHKCVTRGTLEERISNLLKEKRGMARDLLDAADTASLLNMSDNELLSLVSLDIDQAVMRTA